MPSNLRWASVTMLCLLPSLASCSRRMEKLSESIFCIATTQGRRDRGREGERERERGRERERARKKERERETERARKSERERERQRGREKIEPVLKSASGRWLYKTLKRMLSIC